MYKDECIGTIHNGIEVIHVPRKWFSKNKCFDRDEQTYKNYKDWLFSPWNPTSVWYEVTPREDGTWCCTYTSVVYDTLEVTFFECGDTPNSALKKCQTNLLKVKTGVYD